MTQLEKIKNLKTAVPRDEIDRALLGSEWYLTPNERKNYPPKWVELLKDAAKRGWRMR